MNFFQKIAHICEHEMRTTQFLLGEEWVEGVSEHGLLLFSEGSERFVPWDDLSLDKEAEELILSAICL